MYSRRTIAIILLLFRAVGSARGVCTPHASPKILTSFEGNITEVGRFRTGDRCEWRFPQPSYDHLLELNISMLILNFGDPCSTGGYLIMPNGEYFCEPIVQATKCFLYLSPNDSDECSRKASTKSNCPTEERVHPGFHVISNGGGSHGIKLSYRVISCVDSHSTETSSTTTGSYSTETSPPTTALKTTSASSKATITSVTTTIEKTESLETEAITGNKGSTEPYATSRPTSASNTEKYTSKTIKETTVKSQTTSIAQTPHSTSRQAEKQDDILVPIAAGAAAFVVIIIIIIIIIILRGRCCRSEPKSFDAASEAEAPTRKDSQYSNANAITAATAETVAMESISNKLPVSEDYDVLHAGSGASPLNYQMLDVNEQNTRKTDSLTATADSPRVSANGVNEMNRSQGSPQKSPQHYSSVDTQAGEYSTIEGVAPEEAQSYDMLGNVDGTAVPEQYTVMRRQDDEQESIKEAPEYDTFPFPKSRSPTAGAIAASSSSEYAAINDAARFPNREMRSIRVIDPVTKKESIYADMSGPCDQELAEGGDVEVFSDSDEFTDESDDEGNEIQNAPPIYAVVQPKLKKK